MSQYVLVYGTQVGVNVVLVKASIALIAAKQAVTSVCKLLGKPEGYHFECFIADAKLGYWVNIYTDGDITCSVRVFAPEAGAAAAYALAQTIIEDQNL